MEHETVFTTPAPGQTHQLRAVFSTPVRPTRTVADANGTEVTKEWDSINSVEITNTVKDGPRVSAVKVYAASETEAADRVVAAFQYAEQKLAAALRDKADGTPLPPPAIDALVEAVRPVERWLGGVPLQSAGVVHEMLVALREALVAYDKATGKEIAHDVVSP